MRTIFICLLLYTYDYVNINTHIHTKRMLHLMNMKSKGVLK